MQETTSASDTIDTNRTAAGKMVKQAESNQVKRKRGRPPKEKPNQQGRAMETRMDYQD